VARRNLEFLPVLGHGPAGDVDAPLLQAFRDLLV